MKLRWPFSELFRPLAIEALSNAKAPDIVREAFALHLEHRLAEVGAQCIHLHFSAYRASQKVFTGSQQGCCANFTREFGCNGLEDLLREYPVLSDAILKLCHQEIVCAEIFAERLTADGERIRLLLASGELGRLVNISAGWSDPHHGGQTVVRICFENGAEIFYKPRSLQPEQIWKRKVEQINKTIRLPLSTVETLDQGSYGWAIGIEGASPRSKMEAKALYWQFGAILCFAWLLDAVDIHRDNVVVGKHGPVVIDLETLLHPLDGEETKDLRRTCMIPTPHAHVDDSCLGSGAKEKNPQVAAWFDVGRDCLDFRRGELTPSSRGHLITSSGGLVEDGEAAVCVFNGFDEAFSISQRDREFIASWRSELAGAPRRQIFRATRTYAEMHRQLAFPSNLKQDQDRQDALQRLVYTRSTDSLLAASEVAQIEHGDIPIFSVQLQPLVSAPWNEIDACRSELYRWVDTIRANR